MPGRARSQRYAALGAIEGRHAIVEFAILVEHTSCEVGGKLAALVELDVGLGAVEERDAKLGFFMPAEEAEANKAAYEQSGDESVIKYLNFMPRAFDEGAVYYYTSRGAHSNYDNRAVAWSQLEHIDYNVTEIMRGMTKPYLLISGENAWSKPASTELFEAVPEGTPKEMYVVPEAGHFDLYDLAPYVSEAFAYIEPFFAKNL